MKFIYEWNQWMNELMIWMNENQWMNKWMNEWN